MGKDITIQKENIREAYELINSRIRKTPLLQLNGNDLGIECQQLILKLELFQHSGSFKTRGAFTNLLMRRIPHSGVIDASGGNHGVAVAFATSQLKIPATIFVPSVASPAKKDRIRDYGAQLIIAGERYADALAESERHAAQTGALTIHAYDQIETLLGQGTVGLEIEVQDPALDTLFVAVGGGGLIGGIASWYAGKIRIIAVEPELAPTLTYALRAGEPVEAPAGGVAADSLAPKKVGNLMFPIAQKWVEETILVSDEDILYAQRLLWSRARIAAEPGGAAALAALTSERYKPRKNERIGVIVCGGNTEAVDFDRNPAHGGK